MLIAGQQIGLQISIVQGAGNGLPVYLETQTPITNANGLASFQIGTGQTINDFSTIDWSSGPYFIKTEVDPLGGTNYTITGISQILSVPYALYAKTSGSSMPPGANPGDILYWDGNSWASVHVGFNEQVLTICDGMPIWKSDASCGEITSLNCSSAINNGTLIKGMTSNGVINEISYLGGNGGSFNGKSFSSSGIAGLTATISNGSFVNGSGTLTVNITGTPGSSGTALFSLDIGGQSCNLERTVVAGQISSLFCDSAINNGNLVSGLPLIGVNSVIPYSGGLSNAHNGQTVSSTGISGLTAVLQPGYFGNGEGSLIYNISGTPSSSGIAFFSLNLGGQSCILERTVVPGQIASLNCNSEKILDIDQIQINGEEITIDYTGGNGGPYSNQAVASTGVLGLSAELTSGKFLYGIGAVNYTITGIPDAFGIASFDINLGGRTCVLDLLVSGYSTGTVHCDFPTEIVGVKNSLTGKIWMDRNLGASQVAINSSHQAYFDSGNFENVGLGGLYWTSTITGSDSKHIRFFGGGGSMSGSLDARANGYSVRCIKD